MQDFWPANINKNVPESPIFIMREQARLLGEKTGNLVKADVGKGAIDQQSFVYHFYIIAPTLNNYHYRLFTIEHGIEMYPLTLYVDESLGIELNAAKMAKGAAAFMLDAVENLSRMTNHTKLTEPYTVTVSSQEAFVTILREILNSNRTLQIIRSLLSQITPELLQPQLTT